MAVAECNADLLENLVVKRSKFTEARFAKNTQNGYRFNWNAFRRWANLMGFDPLPSSVETISLYVTSLLSRGLKVSSAERCVAAVGHIHVANGHPTPVTPEIRELLRGARRFLIDQVRQVRPLSIENLHSISELLRADATAMERNRRAAAMAVRNRAMVLVGFASALRSASIVELLLADVEFEPRGLVLRIRREKTDQEGKGRLIGITHSKHPAHCPVRALGEWIKLRGPVPGPLFSRFSLGPKDKPLEPECMCDIVQQCIRRIGLDSKLYGSHSMRAGFVTEAGLANVSVLLIKKQTGHRDMASLERYFRRQDVFRANPLALMDW